MSMEPEFQDEVTSPKLTPRERLVLEFLWAGLSNRDIALRMNVGIRTLDAERQSLRRKFRVSSHVELVRAALRCGILKV